MKRTMTSVGYGIPSIPMDLMFEILLKLPAKSVLRFRYVSKLWFSIINSKQFIDAFMTLSLSRPYLVLDFDNFDNRQMLYLSSPHQSCSCSSSSSLLVTEKHSLTLPELKPDFSFYQHKHFSFNNICNSVRGFVCYRHRGQFVVYNLTTQQVIHFKNFDYYNCSMYLGYDPNSDHYKILRLMALQYDSYFEHNVCTLGGQGDSNSWRPIKTSILYYHCYQNGVCIDGVVYYEYKNIQNHCKIGGFHVGSELLSVIETPGDLLDDLNIYFGKTNTGKLANYMGKLAVYCCINDGFILWILDDVKNHVWSKKTHMFQLSASCTLYDFVFRFEGITGSGEIVYVPINLSHLFEIYCCDMEKKMERRVRFEGLPKIHRGRRSLLCSYVDNIVYL